MEKFNQLISSGVREGVSDFHLTGGHPVVWRKNGHIGFDGNQAWSHSEVDELVRKVLSPEQMQMLKSRLSVDVARGAFVHPSENFKPSEEATPEIIYRSKVMGSPSRVSSPERPSPDIRESVGLSRGVKRHISGEHYVIDEDESIEEVIAQISKSDHFDGRP